MPRRAQIGERLGEEALRELAAGLVADERVVVIARGRQIEELLQDDVQVRRGFEVLAAYDMGHALQRVVEDDREVVARRDLLARDDRVAPTLRARRDECFGAVRGEAGIA